MFVCMHLTTFKRSVGLNLDAPVDIHQFRQVLYGSYARANIFFSPSQDSKMLRWEDTPFFHILGCIVSLRR